VKTKVETNLDKRTGLIVCVSKAFTRKDVKKLYKKSKKMLDAYTK